MGLGIVAPGASMGAPLNKNRKTETGAVYNGIIHNARHPNLFSHRLTPYTSFLKISKHEHASYASFCVSFYAGKTQGRLLLSHPLRKALYMRYVR